MFLCIFCILFPNEMALWVFTFLASVDILYFRGLLLLCVVSPLLSWTSSLLLRGSVTYDWLRHSYIKLKFNMI